LHTILRLSTANWSRFFTAFGQSEGTEISSCSVELPVDRQARRTMWSSVLFQALMSKSWNAVFWLWAIRARSRGPWGLDWLPGKWSGGAEARSGLNRSRACCGGAQRQSGVAGALLARVAAAQALLEQDGP